MNLIHKGWDNYWRRQNCNSSRTKSPPPGVELAVKAVRPQLGFWNMRNEKGPQLSNAHCR
jgi:hypothetical protein